MGRELSAFTERISSFETNDRDRILRAIELTEGRSQGPASILLDLSLDVDTIIAALILGGFRDPPLTESSLDKFGASAALLAGEVKKIDALKTNNKTIREAQNIRNMIFALTGDIRVIIIKLAERLDALRVLDTSVGDERKTAARECLDIYAPLADRLGISWITDEMEDLSLKFMNREAYQQVKTIVAEKREQREQFLGSVAEIIRAWAEEAGLKIEVKSRAKHFYSVYMKMRKKGRGAEEIYDLSGIRIICETVENCYTLLGMVHRLWKPLDGSFKDYIAKPKPNGYQSLHTTVMVGAVTEEEDGAEEGKRLEIQIRTEEMHDVAENGIASHWLYKKGSSRDMVRSQDIGIVNKLRSWKDGDVSAFSGSWLEDIKREIFQSWIYVFTPQGKVIELPAGATPIDFAFQIHSAVGEHCVGAKANGSIIPLSSELKNTQVVDILTSPSAHPHIKWLSLVKTSKARSKIRSWLDKNDASLIAERNAAEKKKAVAEVPSAAEREGQTFNTTPVVQKVVQPLASVMQVRIGDEKNMMIRFARCCNPVTGDAIVGYVSRGRGIIVHRKNCSSLANNPEIENRKIEAEWEKAGSVQVKRFRIEAKYSANLFSEIEGAIQKRQGHLLEGRLEETSLNRLTGIFTMQLVHDDDIKMIMKSIRNIPGIIKLKPLN